MLLPLYIIVVVVNIVAKNNNYYIKTSRNPDFDVRVKRDAGFSEFENEGNESSMILNELIELIEIYINNDENYTNLSKREPDRPRNVVSDVNTSGGVKELRNNATTRKEVAFILNELLELITEYNNYDKTHPNDSKRVKRRNVESSIPVTDDLNSDSLLELQHNAIVWRESAAKNIENVWNNITAEMNKLAELMAQYEDMDLDEKEKREVDRDKNIDSDENISGEVTELKNNTKVWKEIASLVDEIKVLLTEFNDDIGENPKISIRVRRVADNAKIIENDVGTSVGVTELSNNTRLSKNTELILSEIQELISKYKKSISDIKEPRERQPDSRAKRHVSLAFLGQLGNIFRYSPTIIEVGDTELKDNYKHKSQIPLENLGLSPKETNTEQMVPKNQITSTKLLKERLSKKQEEEEGEVGLFNEPVQPDHIAEKKKLDKEHYQKAIPRLEKLEINKDEIDKISENIHTDIPEKPIEKFYTESDVEKVKPNIGFEKDDHIDTNKRCHEFKNYDEMKTLKILKAFDDIDGLLEIHVLESSIEEEKITDDKSVIKHMESGQEYQLVVDYTDVRKPNDVSNNCVTPKIKNIRYKTSIEREKPKKSSLKTITNKEQNKIIIDNSLKLTDTERNLFNPVSSGKENIKIQKRSTFLKILKDSTLLNKKRVTREASPGNRVSKFFSNIYKKIYDMMHTKTDKDVNSDLLLRDDSYDSYGNMYQQNNINNNQNRGNNQFENNRINDKTLSHSEYTYINNSPVNNNPSGSTNMYDYGYRYNTPTNGYSTNSAPYNIPTNGFNVKASNYNYANDYYYRQPLSNGSFYSRNGYPYNTYNGYNNGFITPMNGNNLNNPSDHNNYGNGYGSSSNVYRNKPTQGNGYYYNTGYGSNNYNTKPDNGYNYNTGNGYNTTQNHGYRYNVTDFNNNGTSTEQTIVRGCIFCANYGCQKNYRWMGVACVPTKRKK